MSAVDTLIRRMEANPGSFIIDEYELSWQGLNGKDYSIWIANGPLFYSGCRSSYAKFSILEKIRIYRALRRLNRHKLEVGLS